ncbi:MAG: hypothetical protein WBI14_00340 [Anaerolineaceae bacterium]
MKGKNLNPRTRRILIALIVAMALLFAFNILHTYVAMEGLAFWGYPYVSSFNEDKDFGIKMKNYHCPLFIANGETKLVGVALTNTTDQDLTAYVQTVISSPNSQNGLVHAVEAVKVKAAATQHLTWKISEANIVNGKYVLARSFISWQPVYVSTRSISCHPLVLNFLGLPSNMVGFGLFMLLGLGTVALSVLFITHDPFTIKYHRPRSSLIYLLGALVIMTVGSLMGSWLIQFLMIILILLGFFAFLQVDFS